MVVFAVSVWGQSIRLRLVLPVKLVQNQVVFAGEAVPHEAHHLGGNVFVRLLAWGLQK